MLSYLMSQHFLSFGEGLRLAAKISLEIVPEDHLLLDGILRIPIYLV